MAEPWVRRMHAHMTCHGCSQLTSRCPVLWHAPVLCTQHACLQASAPRGPQAPVHTCTHRLCCACVRACVQVRGGSEPGSPSKFNGETNGEIGGDGREVGLRVRPPSVGAASQPASSIHSGGVGIESDSEEEREQQPDHRPPHRSPDHRSPNRSADHRTPYRSRSAGPQRVATPASSAGVAALARVRSTRGSRPSS